ncbi:MAG: DNA-directed RNA polymerase [Halobacteria archaeon]|nr:DNA-directed RNA polymerase [Halobacteria archaeon]
MYKRVRLVDTVRVPPERLDNVTKDLILELLQDKLEGRCDEDLGWIVAATDVHEVGEGQILYNEGGVFYEAEFDAIVFDPVMQEVIDGKVSEVVSFGAFVGIGPIDALLHASQIGDDYYSFDEDNERLHSSESNRALNVGDPVRARVVTVSIDERNPRDSKIGLTARQVGLGKHGWLEEEAQRDEEEEAEAEAG